MILVVDYKMGNIGSILNMLKKIGVESKASSDKEDIKKASKLILPGVGSFDSGMKNLENLGLIPILNKKVIEEKTFILGICLGMQLFCRKSEEGNLHGLEWIDADVKKFKTKDSLKIPHMGWNTINIQKNDPIFSENKTESIFYFVHSYHLACDNKNDILATTNHGYDFPSIIKKENIVGVQFHPEKSHSYGMGLLKNFLELC